MSERVLIAIAGSYVGGKGVFQALGLVPDKKQAAQFVLVDSGQDSTGCRQVYFQQRDHFVKKAQDNSGFNILGTEELRELFRLKSVGTTGNDFHIYAQDKPLGVKRGKICLSNTPEPFTLIALNADIDAQTPQAASHPADLDPLLASSSQDSTANMEELEFPDPLEFPDSPSTPLNYGGVSEPADQVGHAQASPSQISRPSAPALGTLAEECALNNLYATQSTLEKDLAKHSTRYIEILEECGICRKLLDQRLYLEEELNRLQTLPTNEQDYGQLLKSIADALNDQAVDVYKDEIRVLELVDNLASKLSACQNWKSARLTGAMEECKARVNAITDLNLKMRKFVDDLKALERTKEDLEAWEKDSALVCTGAGIGGKAVIHLEEAKSHLQKADDILRAELTKMSALITQEPLGFA